ncbi:MAG: trypsin-like peptidase domain-containing protein [Planctomycetes bacterium]|nr:trypsin-like peptidase domain-containing protein [Planctomycetota bacterium]
MSDRRSVFKSVKSATVALAIMTERNDGSCPFKIVGSGFCVDSIGIIVTCRHVLSGFMPLPIMQQIDRVKQTGNLAVRHTPHVIFYGTNLQPKPDHIYSVPTQVSICSAKTDFDVALIRVSPHAAFPRGFPFLEIEDYGNICEGDEIATCGFPLGNYLHDQIGTATSSFTKGIISSIIPGPDVPKKHLKGFQLNLTATGGNSGGPVFSLTTGKVFGVLQGGVVDPRGMIVPNLTKAEPVYPVFEHNSLEEMKKMEIPKTDADCAALMKSVRKK